MVDQRQVKRLITMIVLPGQAGRQDITAAHKRPVLREVYAQGALRADCEGVG